MKIEYTYSLQQPLVKVQSKIVQSHNADSLMHLAITVGWKFGKPAEAIILPRHVCTYVFIYKISQHKRES
jgi:hypothetical protein